MPVHRFSALRQPVLYVTERCVFELAPDGLKMIALEQANAELAPKAEALDRIAAWLRF